MRIHGTKRGRASATLVRVTLSLLLGSSFGAALAAPPAWPLRASASGRFLEDQNRVPFLIAADTAWCMVNGLTDAEIDTYLATRKAQGFNAIQFMLMAKHSGCAVGGGSVDRYGQSPFTLGDDDWSIPNEAYWSRVDAILNKVKTQGMLALVTPAYLGFSCFYGTQGWCAAMDAQSVQRMADFGAFLGNRYKTQGNIVWIAGGDANAMDYAGMDARVDALMSAIAAADTSRQLITAHAGRHVSGFQGYGTHAWLTMNSAYDGESCPDASMAEQIATEYARTPVLPLHSIEQQYDQEGADGRCLADQFLWSALGGGVGQSHGNGIVWNFEAGWNAPGMGIDSPLARVHGNSAKLVRSRRYWLFTPDYAHTVVTAGYGSGASTVATSRASTGETVMAFVPESGTAVTVDMSKVSGSSANAYWYDPQADLATPIGVYPTAGARTFTSPGDARALILDDASASLPPPASADAVFDDPPGAVVGVALSKLPEAVHVFWPVQSRAAGLNASYDVVTGLISDLRAPAGYGTASCLANGIAAPAYDDSRRDPPPGKGYYYLVRATDALGVGSYGPPALDADSPCSVPGLRSNPN